MPNDLSAFKAEVWEKALVRKLNQVNVMLPHVNKQYDGE